MNKSTKLVQNIAVNPWVYLGSTAVTITSGIYLFYSKISTISSSAFPIILFVMFSIVFFAMNAYSAIIRGDNQKLKDIAESFQEINTIYKDTLFGTFCEKYPVPTYKELINIEKSTIHSICQRIEHIYSKLISKTCTVTVKLLEEDNNRKLYAKTYTRNENDSIRDKPSETNYEVNAGVNTAFAVANMSNVSGNISHFYSENLYKLYDQGEYFNGRPNWKKYYKSAIVVPIRCVGGKENAIKRDIGFLCVDSKSRNRLNNDHHVILLSTLADQIFNFMSIMRGKYNPLREEEERNETEIPE